MASTPPVVGVDGHVPIYDPEALWKMWSKDEIYMGQNGLNKFVPKLHDYVIDPPTFTTWIVDALDTTTLVPTLREIRPANMSFSFSESDVLFGTGPGTQADTYRVYYDKSVLPFTLAVDARLRVAGSMVSYTKLYKGSNTGPDGVVISKVLDSNGQIVSENIALETAAIDSHSNVSIKVVPVCQTTADLTDGEIVTAVFYSDNGSVVSKRQLLVENTSFIRDINVSKKYITHISLVCPFLSQTEDMTIEYPLNIPLDALNLIGRVHYSNGEILELPVNGNKFKMFGLDQYVSTIVGQKLDLVLAYQLSANETSYAGVGTELNGTITIPYKLVTVNPNNSYTIKLFGYPVWINAMTGYQMRWYMFNLDRNLFFDVTTHVRFDAVTGSYDPKGYGYMQRKQVSINLRDVSGSYKPFIHTQMVEIVLHSPPSNVSTSWIVSHEAVHSRPYYGVDLFALRTGQKQLNISSGFTQLNDWIENVYKKTYPLVKPNSELGPLNPTHFALTHQGITTEYPIAEWNSNINTTGDVVGDETVFIRFIRNTGSGPLQLAMAALLVRT